MKTHRNACVGVWFGFEYSIHVEIKCMGASCEIAHRRMPQSTFDDKPTLHQVLECCRRAAGHYLNQCWPRYVSPWCVTRSNLETSRFFHNTRFSCRVVWKFYSRVLNIKRIGQLETCAILCNAFSVSGTKRTRHLLPILFMYATDIKVPTMAYALTHWPLGDLDAIFKNCKFQSRYIDWYLLIV